MAELEALKTVWQLFGTPGIVIWAVVYLVKALKPVYDKHVKEMAAQNRVNAATLKVLAAVCTELNKHGYEIQIPDTDILDP